MANVEQHLEEMIALEDTMEYSAWAHGATWALLVQGLCKMKGLCQKVSHRMDTP